ncbi:MAG: nuclear transport factor 2 family protein [Ferruginibacter sp.]|nr:nuclear transport factor 2 family protein [Ferruginibacter sp.]
MNKQEYNKQVALHWFEAFNEHNLEKLLQLYDDNATHYSPKLKIRMPETNGLLIGKNELTAWWKDAFERIPNLYYNCTSLTANDDRVFLEYLRKVPGEVDILVAEVLEIDERIIASRVYHG